jgi:glycosyltransferase involved in cell wall biosynthesis
MAAGLSGERRIIIDVTSLARWAGPPVGIVRVVHALSAAGAGDRALTLAVYDSTRQQFRLLNPRWAEVVLGWAGLIDRHIPGAFPRNLVSRHGLVMALERLRLTTRASFVARCAGGLQRAVLAARAHQFPMYDPRGARIAVVPADLAFGPEIQPGPDDTILLAGMGWSYGGVERLRAMKTKSGCRVAAICYDLIPITHPDFYHQADREMFALYWRELPGIVDQVLFSAKAIQKDFERWCVQLSLALPAATIVDFGYDPPPLDQPTALPAGLRPGRFVLFVSTIEPRKGHGILLEAWRRLTARNDPAMRDFQLVFVGRPGWLVDDLLEQLRVPPPGIVHLATCSDTELAGLYENAAFCCYPSCYEGFGLPLIEAFARGKAVLSSRGGALSETAGDLAPCLDPLDADAWSEALADWILHPDQVAAWERRIIGSFRHPNWEEAARTIFAELSRPDPLTGDVRRGR